MITIFKMKYYDQRWSNVETCGLAKDCEGVSITLLPGLINFPSLRDNDELYIRRRGKNQGQKLRDRGKAPEGREVKSTLEEREEKITLVPQITLLQYSTTNSYQNNKSGKSLFLALKLANV